MFLTADLTELPLRTREEMKRLLTDENAHAMAMAKIRQAKIAQFYHNNRPRSMEGIGGMTMSIDPYWLNYFRWQLGVERVHQDPDVKKWILKNNPEFRVKHTGTKLLFASAAVPGGVKRTFKKTYEPMQSEKCKVKNEDSALGTLHSTIK